MTTDSTTNRFQAERLMVIIPDRLSDLITKGEVTERYYNPGEYFREVHIVLTNDDRPDPSAVQQMVGEAHLQIHNLPTDRHFFVRTLGWRRRLMGHWTAKAVDLARVIKPQLVRCHGAAYNALAASEINRKLGIPYVVSLHTNPDGHVGLSTIHRFQRFLANKLAYAGLREAAVALPVYESIRPYLERLGIARIELAYNVVSPALTSSKSDYQLHDPIQIISVGRQLVGKNPVSIIKAMVGLPGAQLTLVGDGPLHNKLQAMVDRAGIRNRVTFLRSLPNNELCRRLAEYDLFVVQTEFWEVPKTVLEGMLAGLPVIINAPNPNYVPEINSAVALLVDNNSDGYLLGLKKLIANDALRESLGREAERYAREKWDPVKTEARYVQIYRTLLANKNLTAQAKT